MNFIRASSAFTVRLSNWMALILNSCSLPQQCLLCAGSSRRALCDACYALLPWLPRAHCPQCALPTTNGALCGKCLQHPPHFDRVIAACVYAYPLTELICSYKHQGTLALAPLLAQAITVKTDGDGAADLLVPLPLSRERLRERGFNQALEISRVISRATRIPLVNHACRRVRDSVPQAALPWNERRKNIRGVFACDADLTGKRVAVIDDVLTTGATLNEIAKTLKRAGAAEVQ